MNKFFFIGAFFVALVANIAGGEMGNTMLQYVSKALLMPLLAGYFIYSIKGFSNILSRWLLAALFFSWAGDVLLLLGLSAFLLAHVFYIIAFQNIRGREAVRFRLLLLAIVAVYYAGLIYLLYPRLANMRLPVLVYGVVISTMFMLAMHMLFIRNRVPGKWMMVGALLFVLSDSTLAVNKFYQAFEGAGIIIMVTYGLAQFSIINGAVEYIRRSND
jgi:uncharacterized membrane protein YhhN